MVSYYRSNADGAVTTGDDTVLLSMTLHALHGQLNTKIPLHLHFSGYIRPNAHPAKVRTIILSINHLDITPNLGPVRLSPRVLVYKSNVDFPVSEALTQ